MNVEGTDYFSGQDITSELVVSRCGFNPDDLFAARACPGCGRQPSAVSAVDIADNRRFRAFVRGDWRDPLELRGSELLYCRCGRCGAIYSVTVFGPAHRGGMTVTGYLVVRQDGFLTKAIGELEALVREGETPGDVAEWITSRLTGAIDRAFDGMDGELCFATEDWNESRYRTKWLP